jgi:hypothetical protein
VRIFNIQYTTSVRQGKVEENEGRRAGTKVKLKYARGKVVGRARQGKLVMEEYQGLENLEP